MRDRAARSVAGELGRRGLAAPTLLMLEAHRPLRPLLAMAATFVLPVARPLLGRVAADLARTLDDDAEYDLLIGHLRREAGA